MGKESVMIAPVLLITASVVSVLCESLLRPRISPFHSVAAFLAMPLVLAALVGEWWIVLVAPFVFWGYAWFFLWNLAFAPRRHPVLAADYAVASLVSSGLGLLLRRLAARFRNNRVSG